MEEVAETYREKQKRYSQINVFWYLGKIVSIPIPIQYVKDNKSNVIRKIVVQYTYLRKRKAQCIMSIPNCFDMHKVEQLMKRKVSARFKFNIRVVKSKYGTYNVMNCMAIEPISPRNAYLKQEVNYDAYAITSPRKVDADGYAFPYTY